MEKITDDERINMKIREYEQSSGLRLNTREKWLFKAGYVMGQVEQSKALYREQVENIRQQIEGDHKS